MRSSDPPGPRDAMPPTRRLSVALVIVAGLLALVAAVIAGALTGASGPAMAPLVGPERVVDEGAVSGPEVAETDLPPPPWPREAGSASSVDGAAVTPAGPADENGEAGSGEDGDDRDRGERQRPGDPEEASRTGAGPDRDRADRASDGEADPAGHAVGRYAGGGRDATDERGSRDRRGADGHRGDTPDRADRGHGNHAAERTQDRGRPDDDRTSRWGPPDRHDRGDTEETDAASERGRDGADRSKNRGATARGTGDETAERAAPGNDRGQRGAAAERGVRAPGHDADDPRRASRRVPGSGG